MQTADDSPLEHEHQADLGTSRDAGADARPFVPPALLVLARLLARQAAHEGLRRAMHAAKSTVKEPNQ